MKRKAAPPESKRIGLLIEVEFQPIASEDTESGWLHEITMKINGTDFYRMRFPTASLGAGIMSYYQQYTFLREKLETFLIRATVDAYDYAYLQAMLNQGTSSVGEIKEAIERIETHSSRIRGETLKGRDRRKNLKPEVSREIQDTIDFFVRQGGAPTKEEFAEKLGGMDGSALSKLLKTRNLTWQAITRRIEYGKRQGM